MVFKNRENARDFLAMVLLAFAVTEFGTTIVRNIYTWANILKWLGFESIRSQMVFCYHPTIIIYTVSALLFGVLVDRIIIQKNYSSLSRKIYWFILGLFIIQKLFLHYYRLNAIAPYDEVVFNYAKYLICY